MKSSIFLILLLSLSARADWDCEIKIENAQMGYTATEVSKEHILFVQTSGDIPIQKTVNNKSEYDNDIRVPGMNSQPGYSYIRILKTSDNTTLIQVDKMNFEYKKQNPLKYEATAIIENGNWEDLMNGKTVRLTLTPEGIQNSNEAIFEYMKRAIEIEAKSKTAFLTPKVQLGEFNLNLSSLNGNLNGLFQRLDNSVRFAVSLF